MSEFYTYFYLRHDGTPYYVGKGKDGRAFSRCGRTIPVPEPARIFIQHWGSEDEAFEMEKYYIQFFGRKDNGTGILRNFTDGGEGMSGHVYTEASKLKMSAWQKGKPKGQNAKIKAARAKQVITAEHKANTSATMKGRVPKNIKTFYTAGADALRGKPWSAARRAAQEARG